MNHLLLVAHTLLTVPLTSFLHFILWVLVHRSEQALVKDYGLCAVESGVLLHAATMKLSSQGKISDSSLQKNFINPALLA